MTDKYTRHFIDKEVWMIDNIPNQERSIQTLGLIIRQLLDDHETMRRALTEIESGALNPQHIARLTLNEVTK